MLYDEAMGGGGDGQEKGKKKASDGRHDARNPDGFNGPRVLGPRPFSRQNFAKGSVATLTQLCRAGLAAITSDHQPQSKSRQ